jgi:phosphoglycolate phosphatase-like HAD superfamily hydrolase
MIPGVRLILDFDGVICDAMEECALVTWLGVHAASPRAPVSSYLTAMPRGFVDRFRTVRDYARLLDHFLVAHRPAAASIRTQARFDAIFACIAREYVREFTRSATATRARCRAEEPRFWLDLHAFYPGITELLREHAGQIAIVTAKDEDSVRTILGWHGLADTVTEVIGACSRKAEAVQDLCQRHGTAPPAVTFIDDNLANARQVAATGARSYWAMWGYHTGDDAAAAEAAGISRLELADLSALTVA